MDSTTPLSALYFHADHNPEGVALISGSAIWSFRRMRNAVEQVAQALHARGVRSGDRVALHMFNVAELAIAYFACFRLGAIAAPLNTRYKTPELRAALHRLRPAVYIGQLSLYPLIVPIETGILAADARYVVGDDSLLGQPRSWESLLAGSTLNEALEPPHVNAPAVLLSTSGTTGESKFVTHSAATLIASAEACRPIGFEGAQIAINAVPMVHASGFFMLLAGLRFGAIQILIERFDAEVVLDAIERYYGTWFVGLPFMFVELMRRQRARPRKVESLEFCAAGGDVLPSDIQQGFPEVFGVPVYSLWAATEVVGALIHGLRHGPVSRIARGAQVRVVDEHGDQVRRGEMGEMLIRAPNVSLGYWMAPGHIEPASVDGWYRTGDLVRQGDQDDVWFVARRKDLIIRAGSNISPVEVERVLLAHPAVMDAGIVGVPDEELGQRVAGAVRLASASGSDVVSEILASAKAQLADYKVPEWLHVVAEIPRNALGKIDRAALLKLLLRA